MAGTLLAVVGKPEKLKVKAEINEADAGRLALGQPVNITSSAVADARFAGLVSKIGPSAVSMTGSGEEQADLEITVSITEANSRLKPGYTVDLSIVTASKSDALVIPHESVIEKNGVKEVFVVEKEKAFKRRIQTGISTEVYVTVEDGLQLGDTVIVSPLFN